MQILFVVPDNRITKNYMPVLWPWLLKALTPQEHRVTILDGNASSMSAGEIALLARNLRADLVGIGAMTRTVQTAYTIADEVRQAGIPVIMGGPHVSAPGSCIDGEPNEILREASLHADSIVMGEADEIWPRILEDMNRGGLQSQYRSEIKPTLQNYPRIPWEEANLKQFTVIPKAIKMMIRACGYPEFDFNLTPVETGRGCPYGCDFCTVTTFFGDKVRIRSIESVLEEIALLKELKRRFIFFVDDNFAIYDKFGKSDPAFLDRSRRLMQAMIDTGIRVPWAAQISTNLLDPETPGGRELVDLMHGSGCIGVYIGLESVLPESLKDVSKSFNKPANYQRILNNLDRSGIYPMAGFIYGMDSDRVGVAEKTWEVVKQYPPSTIPIFSQLTPLPGTPQYRKLREERRLVEGHWKNYRPYAAAFQPMHMSPEELQSEVRTSWKLAYAPESIFQRMHQMRNRPFFERVIVFAANLCMRGVFFPQMNLRSWIQLFWRNRRSFWELFFHSRKLTKRTHVKTFRGSKSRISMETETPPS